MTGRLALALSFLVLWLGGIVVRLYGLQVADHAVYAERAARQQQREVVLDAPRGAILDARGRQLAVSIEVDSVAAEPHKIDDPEAAAKALGAALGLDRDERRNLRAKLATDRHFAWVARKPDPDLAAAVEKLDLSGIFLLRESKRYYPLRTLAGQVVGFVGTDNVGLSGLEAGYDQIIASQPGLRVVVQDGRAGKVLHPSRDLTAALPGDDLHLTLDATVQHIVERELAAAVERTNADRGSVVVLEPTTGAIVAMASYPSLDPNRFGEYPQDRWRNLAVTDAFEPGSTFKMITLAAALDRGVLGLDDTLDCERGALVVHGQRIRDHHPFDVLSVRQVLAKSSNVGAMKIGFAAGRQSLYDAIRAFGFGKLTGVDLPGENAGLLMPLRRWGATTPAYNSFGQGLSTTALQLARSYAVVANGGNLVKPHVVRAIGERRLDPTGGHTPERPISAKTVQQLRSALESVVLEGTGGPASVAGYRVAGKTGTAEKALPGRGYVAGHYVSSFIGFTPVETPALVISVVIDEPWPLYHGSQAAAPAFAAIARQALLYLGVPPRREAPRVWPGEIARDTQAPSDGSGPTRRGDSVRLAATAPTSVVPKSDGVPNFAGLTKRESVYRSSRLGLQTKVHGSGFVRRQVPAPGTPLERAGGAIELWLSSLQPTTPVASQVGKGR